MKRMFISQPMRGLTDEEILSIQFLSEADIAYFGGDWRNARGCKIENDIARAYGIRVIEEEI